MQNPELLKSVGELSRVKCNEPSTGAQRLEFELEINKERTVMFDLATMLDTLWFAEEMKLVAPLPASWWDNAGEYKVWPKPDASPSNLLALEKLDELYAEAHAKIAGRPMPVFEMIENGTNNPYVLALFTLLQCVVIAEQMSAVPPLETEWKARVMPPALRESAQVAELGDLH